jgi:hypothetical protein
MDDRAWGYSKLDIVSKTLGKCSKRMTKYHEFENLVRGARVARPHGQNRDETTAISTKKIGRCGSSCENGTKQVS